MKSLEAFVKANFDTMTSEERKEWLRSWRVVRITTIIFTSIVLMWTVGAAYFYLSPEEEANTDMIEELHTSRCNERVSGEAARCDACHMKIKEISEAVKRD